MRLFACNVSLYAKRKDKPSLFLFVQKSSKLDEIMLKDQFLNDGKSTSYTANGRASVLEGVTSKKFSAGKPPELNFYDNSSSTLIMPLSMGLHSQGKSGKGRGIS